MTKWAYMVLSAALLTTIAIAHAQSVGSEQVDAHKAALQQQLNALEAEIDAQQKILNEKSGERKSLERDVAILDAQIAESKLAIKRRNLVVQQLTTGIQDKENTLFGLTSQMNAELESLAAIMRQKNQLDTTSPVIAVLSSENLSSFFSDLTVFQQIAKSMQSSFKTIQSTKVVTQSQKDDLEQQREEETQLRQVQELEQQTLKDQEAQKNKLIADTKGQEKAYQGLIAQNQKTAGQIRAALFDLTGSAAIPFGKALDYANAASQATGVRPAFLLGIIAEESNLGQNVGTGSWKVDMHPTRDIPVFAKITASLGLNPDSMPVSKKPWYGWGGAMGPAQFIPSTWALYAGYVGSDYIYDPAKDKIGSKTGSHPPNPWDPADAFMAAALYLGNSGADEQTKSAEFRAAMCYLAGCKNASNKSLQFYGNQVAALAADFQAQIDILAKN